MQRPCFALAMLLGAMASSVVVVGAALTPSPKDRVRNCLSDSYSAENLSINTAQGRTLAAGLPGPALACEVVLGKMPTVVRGQSVDESFGADDEAAALRWSTLTATGYDAAYDFAMFDGSFDGIGPSQCEITPSIAVELLVEQVPVIALEADPLAAQQVAETECQLDCTGETMIEDEYDEPATKFCPWTGQELPMGIETIAPPTVPADDEPAAETSRMFRSLRSLQTNWSSAKTWVETLANHSWFATVREEIARRGAEQALDDLFGETVTVEARVVESELNDEGTPNWEMESLLLKSACLLEQFSHQLQRVAEQIRDFANHRIVSQNRSEPVTR